MFSLRTFQFSPCPINGSGQKIVTLYHEKHRRKCSGFCVVFVGDDSIILEMLPGQVERRGGGARGDESPSRRAYDPPCPRQRWGRGLPQTFREWVKAPCRRPPGTEGGESCGRRRSGSRPSSSERTSVGTGVQCERGRRPIARDNFRNSANFCFARKRDGRPRRFAVRFSRRI